MSIPDPQPTPYNSPMTESAPPPSEKLPLLPKRKKFLIPVIILLLITMIGSIAGVAIGFVSVKRGEAYKTTMAQLQQHPAVRQHVGQPVDAGLFVFSKHDDRNGTYDLTYTIEGPNGKAAVRSRCERETDDEPWQVTFLDIGVGGREGRVITLVGDPDDPPGSRD